ncbi:MAG TPA: adenylate/guanylate cyclase domain-containing protein [Microlunatus sp.]|nr:adenylate/guanylate cyclase domain-containing protein [Microlunatus sp.]
MPRSRVESRVADLLEDAREARDAGDWQSARALLEAVTALDPTNTEAAAMLAGPATRRQMTLLFCDIVGSTELADQRDPEEVTAIIAQYRAACAAVVAEHDGHIDDHRGDGMLVLFGYPQVDEDDARRGVLCGLRMVERVQQLHVAALPDSRLQVRISVHTDLVVVADGVTGSTANEAARIQQLAEPDTVVISDTTQDLVWPWFETTSLGAQHLRGVSRPVEVFLVQAALPTPRGRTWRDRTSPFVNRSAELGQMEWLAPKSLPSEEGEPAGARAVCVIGPSGMGKTRFTLETARRFEVRALVCACSRMQRNASLHPFRALLEVSCGMTDDDGYEDRRDKLRAALGELPGGEGSAAVGDLPFLAAVLDIPLDLLSAPSEVQPDRLRRQALLAAAGLLQRHASQEPALIFVDDVQWADQSSLDLLTVLLTVPGLRIVIAARDGFEPPWPESAVRRVVLDPLDEAATEELVRQTPSAATLSPERSRELMERSDGVPLFLEELLLTATESASGGIPHRSLQFSAYKIPPALRDPLLARLSRPEVDLEMAQLAAVIGRDVDRDLLQRAVGQEGAEFERRLRTLLDAGLMELVGAQLRFRHELIREVAYETQRRTVLRERHSMIADLLVSAGTTAQRAATVAAAHHLEQAGRVPDAIAVHIQIARADQALGAHEEAARRLTNVLQLLDSTPAGLQRDRTELAVRELRSFSAVTARGYAATETAEDYPRCRQLIEESVTDAEVLPYLIRLWTFYTSRGDFTQAEAINDEVTRRSDAAGIFFPGASLGRGVVDFFQGDFPDARAQLNDALLNGWTADLQVPAEWTLPNDPRAAAFAHLVPSLVVLGDRAAAEQAALDGLERAGSLPYPIGPFSAQYVDCLLAVARTLDGDLVGAAEIGQRLVAVGERHGFAIWSLTGQMQCLYSAVQLGDTDNLPALVQAVELWHQVVAIDSWTPYWFANVGFAQLNCGDARAAIGSFDRALAIAAATGAGFYTAETLRGRGEARRALGDHDAAAADLREALAVAGRQGAVLFEARIRAALGTTA